MKNKKITFLIPSLAGGGSERVCVTLANSLLEEGWMIDLVILHNKRSIYHTELNPNVNFINLNVSNVRFAFIPLLRYVLQKKPDKILVFSYDLVILTTLLRLVVSIKFKIIARNNNTLSAKFNSSKGLKHKFISKLLQFLYPRVDYIINQCESMHKDLIKLFPQLYNKSSYIYNPMNQKVEKYSSNSANTFKEDYVICVGRLEKQKAFHYALDAFSIIAQNKNELRLKILGSGTLRKDLEIKAVQLGINDKVDFEGFQTDIIHYIKNAKMTVLTSIYEGFPNVLIESIALGTPVVAFDCPSGPSEIIKDGVNGYLVEYKNTEKLAEKILLLLNNPLKEDDIIKTSECYRIKQITQNYDMVLKLI